MLLSDIFDTKIVDDKAELDGAEDMFPETGSVGDLVISVGGKFIFQIFICEHACLRLAINYSPGF